MTILMDPLYDAVNSLAARWIKVLPNDATVFSPVSVWPLLAILADAATPAVAAKLQDVLCFTPTEHETLLDAGLRVLRFLDRTRGLDAAVAAWVARALNVKEDWVAQLPAGACGQLTQTAADQAVLDEWARARTQGQLQEFPVQVQPEDQFVLATAVALSMSWVDEFERRPNGHLVAELSGLGSVRTAPGLTVVRVQGQTGEHPAAFDGSVFVDCYLVVGERGVPAASVLGRGLALVRKHGDEPLSPEQVESLAGPCLKKRFAFDENAQPGVPVVNLTTPGFRVKGNHNLVAALGLDAITEPTEHGHFPAITDNPLWVSGGTQAAVARFHQNGFCAAAVSVGLGFGCCASGGRVTILDIKINRPFGFICVERRNRVVTFAGWVTKECVMKNDDDVNGLGNVSE